METETGAHAIEKNRLLAFVSSPGSHEQKWPWLQQAESQIDDNFWKTLYKLSFSQITYSYFLSSQKILAYVKLTKCNKDRCHEENSLTWNILHLANENSSTTKTSQTSGFRWPNSSHYIDAWTASALTRSNFTPGVKGQ